MADVDADGAQGALAAELGGDAWTLDLADRETLAGLQISPDILINNAGIQHLRSLNSRRRTPETAVQAESGAS